MKHGNVKVSAQKEYKGGKRMELLTKAMEEITYSSRKFPEEAFQVISEHREEALPYLYEALEKAIKEGDDLDPDYQLHFYALFFLGEFQDTGAFPKIIELVSLPSDTLDQLIGDTITTSLSDILYNTFNGDLALLEKAIWKEEVNDYVKSDMIEVMGQLYLDGALPKEELESRIKEIVYSETDLGDFFYSGLADTICRCHMIDMLPEIQHLYRRGLIDEMAIGPYEDCVDRMFQYPDYEKYICKKPISASELKGWAMFEKDDAGKKAEKKEFENFLRELQRGMNKTGKKKKIGRNDPCPCGSGKKYKHCCLNKPEQNIEDEIIESEQEQRKCLEDYPELGAQRQEGRIYLEDYYDAKSIEIDQLIYLGIKYRPYPIWKPVNQETEVRRTLLYLLSAFELFKEKCEQEKIESFDAYDKKCAIHYQCRDWIGELLELLKKNGDLDNYDLVMDLCKRMDGDGK